MYAVSAASICMTDQPLNSWPLALRVPQSPPVYPRPFGTPLFFLSSLVPVQCSHGSFTVVMDARCGVPLSLPPAPTPSHLSLSVCPLPPPFSLSLSPPAALIPWPVDGWTLCVEILKWLYRSVSRSGGYCSVAVALVAVVVPVSSIVSCTSSVSSWGFVCSSGCKPLAVNIDLLRSLR